MLRVASKDWRAEVEKAGTKLGAEAATVLAKLILAAKFPSSAVGSGYRVFTDSYKAAFESTLERLLGAE